MKLATIQSMEVSCPEGTFHITDPTPELITLHKALSFAGKNLFNKEIRIKELTQLIQSTQEMTHKEATIFLTDAIPSLSN